MMPWHGWMMLPMIVAWVLAAAVMIATVVFIVRHVSAGSDGASAPLRTLQDRYARGEIDHDEYERRRAALR
jgi:putative membrane protein